MSGELERFDPAEQGGRIAYEHLHRYALCREHVAGKRVLDLACGTGYGSAILAGAAAEVIGVDISAEAIAAARSRHAGGNLAFRIADCFDLPFEAGRFDVVVANEMIEHVADHHGLLQQAKRVLVPGGLLLVSTPNKPVYNRFKPPNSFHVSEMDLPEFQRLLAGHFAHVRLTGTRLALISVGYPLAGSGQSNLDAARVYQGGASGGRPDITTGELQLNDPEYVLAACSDAPVPDLPVPSSLFVNPADDLWLEHERILAWASGLHEEDELLRADLARAREQLARQYSGTGQQRALLSRLLGEMGKRPVPEDDTAIVASLFALNSQMVEARLRLEAAEARIAAEQARSHALAGEADGLRASLAGREAALAQARQATAEVRQAADRLTSQLAERETALVQARQAAADARHAKDRLADELSVAGQTLAERDAALAGRDAALTEREAALAQARQSAADADEAKRRLAGELASTAQKLAEASAELACIRAAEQARTAAQQAASSRRVAQRQRLDAVHRQVHADVARAPQRVAGRIAAPPPPRPRNLRQRLLGRPARLDTRIFSGDWLERQQPGAGRRGLMAYLADPNCHRLDPHPLFAAAAYLDQHPDVADAGMSPLLHYVQHGWREGRNPHPLFPNDWYLARNPDVAADGSINALDHYLQHGWREGRWPNPLFDPRAYLDRYPDVAAAGMEPLTHYLMYGEAEGREPMLAGWDAQWPALVGGSSATAVMRHLLTAPAPASAEAEPAPGSAWPPAPLDDFWPANTMRELVQDRHGDAALALLWYLMSVMQRWRDRPAEFAASDDCRLLLARLRERSAAKATAPGHVPDASIIIPVYNNLLDTLLCLVSLLELDEAHDFEVIVADDGSTDATAALVGGIGGAVRHLRQPQNRGFLGNCNTAAATARGRHVVLLNNDTLVFPGWLDGLLTPFADLAGVGLVGSMLINWDGTLQEAGGIFWRDGSAWNFGRNQDARAPEFNYLKDVDYCSGASIAVPLAVWREMGGFDPLFTPAYCEDSDLAFRLRAAGYRTLYSPASQLVHHEGRSHGRDVSSGVKAYQVLNGERLFDRWRTVLERDHYPNAQNVLRARDRSFGRRHMLVVDHYVPQWDKDAGSRTIYQYMKLLVAEGHAVTFWPDNLWRDPVYTPRLQQLGIEVIHGSRFVDGFAAFMRDRADLYDLVLLSRPHVATNYIDAIRQHTQARIVYYGHDVHFRRMMSQRRVDGLPETDSAVEAMKTLELSVCRRSDLALYPSQEEAALMAGLLGNAVPVRAIPAYCFDAGELDAARHLVAHRAPISGPARLLFVGGFAHTPNVDAITWFCDAVLPPLRAAGYAVSVQIVGSKAGPDVQRLAGADVDVLGFVSDDDLLGLYRQADIVIAPLRYGAGVKGKVIEAMARGVPVVTTDVGAQGIADAQDLMFLGNTPETLAQAVIAAQDHAAARQRCEAALTYIEANYSAPAILDILQAGLAAA